MPYRLKKYDQTIERQARRIFNCRDGMKEIQMEHKDNLKIPIEIAVAWFTEDTRRLLQLSRRLAIDGGWIRLEGWHLFLSAARMDESVPGRLIPANVKKILGRAPIPTEIQGRHNRHEFLKVSSALKRACCSIAAYSRPIRPSGLLLEVFASDKDARRKLRENLGEQLFTELSNSLLLPRFDSDEIEKLLLLKKDFLENYE